MREYASIMLNMIENAGKDLKKQSAEYDRILNVRIANCCQLSRQAYSEYYKKMKMEQFAKGIISECRRAIRNFSEQRGRDLWK